MILSKTAKVKINGKKLKYYQNLGYDAKNGEIIEVKIEDLSKGSHIEIDILCDICSKKMAVPYKRYNRVVEDTGSYVCKECASEKRKQTNYIKYGVYSPAQSKEVQEKMKQTSLERYGVENYSQTNESKEKYRQTCLEKYNVENIFQLQEVKDKSKRTSLERYGTEYPSQSEEIKEKQANTMISRYGVPYFSQIPEVKEKIVRTFFTNGTMATSKQQYYLNNLYGGELNYPVKYYCTDICFPEEKIIIEYDGSGHNLEVQLGTCFQEEFDQKEIIRNNIIKREGYKQMRIISSKDFLPSDFILLKMLSIAKEYFDTTSHTWVNFDIDNSKMINAENKDAGGVFFDYGNLRKIKEIA